MNESDELWRTTADTGTYRAGTGTLPVCAHGLVDHEAGGGEGRGQGR
ncbi:hypothetical protein [Streptomyces sp. NBC_01314]|nr:hypothetical protein OG622_12055 [Streptomyces sp. NBC_01314]